MLDKQKRFEIYEKILEPKDKTEHFKEQTKMNQQIMDAACLWHKESNPDKHLLFANMFECTDCMKEIHAGRCVIDICNFDLDMTYYFRSFWDKVKIRDPSECWPWIGGVRHKKQETVAYMPSPFHSARTQSAARVAFWLSRGYTGKLRITHKKGCHYTCCNPLHLKIMGLELTNEPTEIELINFNLGNIHDHARNCRLQAE